MVYGIKPDQREGFILSISKDLLIINFSGKNSHAFYSGRGISDEFSPADIYISISIILSFYFFHFPSLSLSPFFTQIHIYTLILSLSLFITPSFSLSLPRSLSESREVVRLFGD